MLTITLVASMVRLRVYLNTGSPSEPVAGVNWSSKSLVAFMVSSAHESFFGSVWRAH